MSLSKRDQEYLARLTEKVQKLGYDTFEQYLSSHLAYDLVRISEVLGESYHKFQKFHHRYVRSLRGE